MARPRVDLQTLLETITEHVYFEPPSNEEIQEPCIIYNRAQARTQFADNSPYRYTKRYAVTVIDRDPDSLIPDKVAGLDMCTHDRFYKANGLNHDVYTLYF